jgi:hypothetical protein
MPRKWQINAGGGESFRPRIQSKIVFNIQRRSRMLTTEMKSDEKGSHQLQLPDATPEQVSDVNLEREKILAAVNSCQLNTMELRVAWLLNTYPNTRDSDIALQIRYWQTFESDRFDGGAISVRDYYRLARLTSLARARATIQNKLKLFQASDEVKKRRKQIEGDELANARKKHANYLRYAIYMDESGKNSDNLVVGSLWYLNGTETINAFRLIYDWKLANEHQGELHFQSITEAKLPHYIELVDAILGKIAAISFKAISVPRRGIPNLQDALLKLAYHLIVRGVEHEHTTSRAPLPRGIQVCKDAEEIGQDKLFAAELADRLRQASRLQFNDNLYVEEFSAETSVENYHLQLADLFTSSVARKLNSDREARHAKDKFANYFLGKLGISVSEQHSESLGDMTVHITL